MGKDATSETPQHMENFRKKPCDATDVSESEQKVGSGRGATRLVGCSRHRPAWGGLAPSVSCPPPPLALGSPAVVIILTLPYGSAL